MVGSCYVRMEVRYLDNGHQRQQDKTQNHRDRQSTRLCASFSADLRLESCQITRPCLSGLKIGRTNALKGFVVFRHFVAEKPHTPASLVRLNCVR